MSAFQITRARWIAFAVGVITVIVTLFLLALFSYFGGCWEHDDASMSFHLESAYAQSVILPPTEPAPELYQGIPLDIALLQLDRRALDEAYHQQLLRLWSVWLTEGAKDPKYFATGLKNARRAYGLAAKAVTDREKAVEQTPMR